MRLAGFASIVLTAWACAACTEVVPPLNGHEAIGVLQLVDYDGLRTVGGDESVTWSVAPDPDVLSPPRLLVAPDTVKVDAAFDVTVTTIGLTGCWRAAGQTVERRERVIELTPVDAHSGARVCTDLVQFLARTSRVRLDSPGVWTLRVKGRRLLYPDGAWEEQVTAERKIVAR